MRKLRLKNFFKYTLAVVCVCCAMIAGVFSLQKNNVKADEITTSTNISIDNIALDNTIHAGAHSWGASIAVSATVKGDALSKFNTGDFDVDVKYEVGKAYLFAGFPADELCSTKKYYVLSIYPGESEEDKIDGTDTIKANHGMYLFSKGNPKILTGSDYAENGENFTFYLPITWGIIGASDIISRTTEYTWFIDLWEVTEREYVDEYHGALVTGWWYIDSTKTSVEATKIYSSNNHINTSINDVARNQLSALASDSTANVDWLFNYAGLDGYVADTEVTVNLNYKAISEDSDKSPIVEDYSEQHIIPARIMFNEQEVLNYVGKLSGKKNVSDFNCTFVQNYYENDEVYELESKIFLQAKEIKYEYSDIYGVGNIDVSYEPFKYKDFSIYITNNDETNKLTMNYYSSYVSTYEDLTTITFYFEKIEEHLYNKVNWLFDLMKSDFTVSGVPDGVSCVVDDYSVTITFKTAEQSKLMDVQVFAVCKIDEDVQYKFSYKYVRLNDNLEETAVTSAVTVKWFSELVALSKYTFYNKYGETIEKAITPTTLNGSKYCEFSGIRKVWDKKNKSCTVTVLYEYKTTLRIKSNLSSTPVCVVLNKNTLEYDYSDLYLDNVKEKNFRIKNVSSKNKTDLDIEFSEASPKDIIVRINCDTNEKKIIDIDVLLSGTWYLEINYLAQYKNSPFAVHKTVNKEVSVADYGDMKALTTANVAEILGVNDFFLFPIAGTENEYMTNGYVIPEKIEYVDESKYKVTLEYAYTTINYMQSDGTMKENKVPLTCYDDWCRSINSDWSILWLNRGEEAKWFLYSNDVPRNKLYGFFSSLVFEEKVSDLNSWFKSLTYKGCVVVNSCEAVSGSSMYRFYYNQLGTIWHLYGLGGMLFEEYTDVTFGKDTNKILYSYFFYLDCSTTDDYMSHNGADNSYDNDSAIDNTKEDFFEQLKSLKSEGFWQTPFGIFLIWTAIILGGLLVLAIAIKIFNR